MRTLMPRHRGRLWLDLTASAAAEGGSDADTAVIRMDVMNRARLRSAENVKIYVESVEAGSRRLPLPILPARWTTTDTSETSIPAGRSESVELLRIETAATGRSTLSTSVDAPTIDLLPGLYQIRLAVVSGRSPATVWTVDLSFDEPSRSDGRLLERIRLSAPFPVS
jgi:hypothetical protein